MSKAQEINNQNFEQEVLKCGKPVLVDFYAPWCGPCQMMGPVLDELAEEMGDKVKIVKLNTEEADNAQLAQKYQIMSIPNLKLFKNGEVIKNIVGFRMKDQLKADLESVV